MCSVEGCSRPLRSMGMCASHYAAQWNKNNKERYNKNWKAYYKRQIEKRRYHSRDLMKNYGLTTEDYEILLKKQNGLCAICNRAETSKSPIDESFRRLAVDHDHETGKVRGLLCASCNNGLGCFKDNIDLLQASVDYLKLAIGRDVEDG